MNKKRVGVSFIAALFLCGAIGGTTTKAFAGDSVEVYNTMERRIELQQKHYDELKELGFPDDTIEVLGADEIEKIVENDSKFLGESVSHTLYITMYDESAESKYKVVSTGLTESEFELYNVDKKRVLNEKVNELKVEEPLLENYAMTTTTPLDSATLTLTIDSYEGTITSSVYKRVIGTNFKWNKDPFWSFTDGIGIQVGGNWWATYDRGGYYYDGRSTYNLEGLVANQWGVAGKIPIGSSYDGYTNYGRIWTEMGNNRTSVPSATDFTVYADYKHTVVAYTGINVSVGSGGVSITGNIGTTLKAANQAYYTYRTPR